MIIKIVFILFILSIVANIFKAQEPGLNIYCCLKCGPEHTMCKFNRSGPGPNCTGFISSKLTSVDRLKILDMHNRFRQQMALNSASDLIGAGNMRQMVWDRQLEEVATRWNEQCNHYEHDECRSTPNLSCFMMADTADFHQIGQNMGYKFAIRRMATAEGIIQRWFNEHHYMPRLYYNRLVNTSYYLLKGQLSMMRKKMTYVNFGHFTQLIWAKTWKVGCSVVRRKVMLHSVTALVCNYYPPGNYLFQPIFAPGAACSSCPSGTVCSKEYPGLCYGEEVCDHNLIYPPWCNEDLGLEEEVEEEEEEEEEEEKGEGEEGEEKEKEGEEGDEDEDEDEDEGEESRAEKRVLNKYYISIMVIAVFHFII